MASGAPTASIDSLAKARSPKPAPALAAEAAAASLPPLVVSAERVAATVLQGVHGRRRSGQGDAFWQFRPYLPGDDASRVDWRQSAKSDRLYLRETEWESAQTVALWRDAGPGMDWTGGAARPTKRARADLLLLALASLLLRGGERVRLLGGGRSVSGRGALPGLAMRLESLNLPPADESLPRHARAVLFGDFLAPLAELRESLLPLATAGARVTLVSLLDPAEESLPYLGRVRFEPPGAGESALVPRVEGIRDLYAERLAAHRAGVADITRSFGFRLLSHRTDQPPGVALLALWQALAPQGAR
ncbi:DUF58 domain-containing protein [Muricoccus radiodurans]|uniref:DUF58 domain-containing protein n=1 Tax=Muricoccus radiodurans TaxID=2231721 RepID=UPI003CF494E6